MILTSSVPVKKFSGYLRCSVLMNQKPGGGLSSRCPPALPAPRACGSSARQLQHDRAPPTKPPGPGATGAIRYAKPWWSARRAANSRGSWSPMTPARGVKIARQEGPGRRRLGVPSCAPGHRPAENPGQGRLRASLKHTRTNSRLNSHIASTAGFRPKERRASFFDRLITACGHTRAITYGQLVAEQSG